jgi:superoxide dismutase, Cu-Zn family
MPNPEVSPEPWSQAHLQRCHDMAAAIASKPRKREDGMRHVATLLVLLFLALSSGSALAQGAPPPQAKGEFKNAAGEAIGNLTLTQMPDGTVMVSASLKGLPPGDHGFHIHAVGSCAPTFDAAGPHYNPSGKQHGLDNPNGPHAGDLPNLHITDDGTGTLSTKTNLVTVTPGPMTIFDTDGSAVVIHAQADDQKTDPSGNSGSRIACAILQPVAAPQPAAQLPAQSSASAEFKTSVGETVGNATLTQNADGSVRLQVQVHGLPSGQHGIHFHQFGACAPTFGAAGEHYNPMGNMHGLENPNGPHAGDLPNLVVNTDGTGSLDTATQLVTLAPGPMTLFDADGTALIIHAFTDDQKTDPSGNSGSRIACAVVQAGGAPAAQPAGQPAQPGAQPAGQPNQLPITGGADTPWLALLAAGLFLFGAGALAMHRWSNRVK